MNLTSERVDDRYLKVFIVAQAVVAEVLSKLFAVLDGLQVTCEFDPDPVSHRDTVFHIEKELLHVAVQLPLPKRAMWLQFAGSGFVPIGTLRRQRHTVARESAAISDL